MIAQRKVIDVTEPTIVLDLGKEFSLFKNHRVEIIIISGSEINNPKSETNLATSAFNKLCGAMRGSVKYIARDFDESDDGDDWEVEK